MKPFGFLGGELLDKTGTDVSMTLYSGGETGSVANFRAWAIPAILLSLGGSYCIVGKS